MAQSLKKVRPGPFDAAKCKVLRDIKSVQPKLPAKAGKDQSSSVANLAVAQPAGGPEMSGSKSATNLVAECRKNSAVAGETSLSSISEVSHPNVGHSVNPFEVLSSTSRIWYDKRLLKESTESTQSLKSANPSFRVLSSAKVNLATASLASLETPEGHPGNPIKSTAVVSTLSKTMTKELTASMQGVKSGVHMLHLASPATADSVSSSAANPIATNPPQVEPGDSIMTQK